MSSLPVKTTSHIHVVINSARRGCVFAVAAGVLPRPLLRCGGELCHKRSCSRDTVSTATNKSSMNARFSGSGMQAAA